MKYLIDTQALIWFADDNSKLSSRAKDLIKSPENEIFVSQFSYVEIAIKIAVRKISLERGLLSLIEDSQNQRIVTLAVKHSHVLAYSEIPLLEDHKARGGGPAIRPYDSGDGISRGLTHHYFR